MYAKEQTLDTLHRALADDLLKLHTEGLEVAGSFSGLVVWG